MRAAPPAFCCTCNGEPPTPDHTSSASRDAAWVVSASLSIAPRPSTATITARVYQELRASGLLEQLPLSSLL